MGMVWDRQSARLGRVIASYMNSAVLPLAVMDGELGAAGVRGLWADFTVVELNIDQELDVNTAFGREIRIDEPAQMDFRAVLAAGGREPRWVE